MKISHLIILTAYLLVSCSNQSNVGDEVIKLTGNTIEDLNKLFITGKSEFLSQEVLVTERYEELSIKFQRSLAENQEWMKQYLKDKKDNLPLPYHKNFGISEDEYEELIDYMNNVKFSIVDQSEVYISNTDDTIFFYGKGDSEIINPFKIVKPSNQILLYDYNLLYKDFISVNDTSNAHGSSWKGHKWEYEYIDEQLGNIVVYSFTVGVLDNTNKTFITLKVREADAGERIMDVTKRYIVEKK